MLSGAETCTGVVFWLPGFCLASILAFVLPNLSGLPGLPGKIKAYQRVGKLPDTALRLHIPKTIADLFPDSFIWRPFRPDLDQAIFEARDAIPKLRQICFQMASFGQLSVKILIKPFPSPHTPLQTIADLVPDGFIRTPFCPDLDPAMFEPRHTFPKPLQICFQMESFGRLFVQIWIRPFSNPETHP